MIDKLQFLEQFDGKENIPEFFEKCLNNWDAIKNFDEVSKDKALMVMFSEMRSMLYELNKICVKRTGYLY